MQSYALIFALILIMECLLFDSLALTRFSAALAVSLLNFVFFLLSQWCNFETEKTAAWFLLIDSLINQELCCN